MYLPRGTLAPLEAISTAKSVAKKAKATLKRERAELSAAAKAKAVEEKKKVFVAPQSGDLIRLCTPLCSLATTSSSSSLSLQGRAATVLAEETNMECVVIDVMWRRPPSNTSRVRTNIWFVKQAAASQKQHQLQSECELCVYLFISSNV